MFIEQVFKVNCELKLIPILYVTELIAAAGFIIFLLVVALCLVSLMITVIKRYAILHVATRTDC